MFKATLSSDERLKSRKQINYLFDKGSQLFSHPLKVYYLVNESSSAPAEGLNLRFGVTVPKAIYKKAVVRNRLKRKIRESYRKAKAEFLKDNSHIHQSVDWFFIYIDRNGNEERLDQAMAKIFDQLSEKLS